MLMRRILLAEIKNLAADCHILNAESVTITAYSNFDSEGFLITYLAMNQEKTHYSLESAIKIWQEKWKRNMTITVNADGSPMLKSSNYSIWPVQVRINELPAHLQ